MLGAKQTLITIILLKINPFEKLNCNYTLLRGHDDGHMYKINRFGCSRVRFMYFSVFMLNFKPCCYI